MSFSWSLYFCQRMVEAAARRVAFDHYSIDRTPAPVLRKDECALAVYVDGAAVFGSSEALVEEKGAAIVKALKDANLDCTPLECEADSQTFTGLAFGRETGRVGVTHDRLWRLRLALLHVLSTKQVSGAQLRRLIGHVTWCGLIRRETFSLLSACYRFVAVFGDRRHRVWPSALKELRWIASLLPFF